MGENVEPTKTHGGGVNRPHQRKEKNEMTKERMTAKQLNNKLINFDEKLKKLQREAQELADLVHFYGNEGEDPSHHKNGAEVINYSEYLYYFADVARVLEELAGFDLEDSIDADRFAECFTR